MAKPKLQPLKQWFCDSCGEIIEQPDHGYLEWRDKRVGSGDDYRRVMYGFRIVHHRPHSPRKNTRNGCYYSNNERGGDLDLPEFLGGRGLIHAANWIDLGSAWNSEYRGPEVGDLREWAVIFRRLHFPYYEEARFHLEQAKSGEEFGDHNQLSFYLPETLKSIIEYYTEE
jgi:hypothetical protein